MSEKYDQKQPTTSANERIFAAAKCVYDGYTTKKSHKVSGTFRGDITIDQLEEEMFGPDRRHGYKCMFTQINRF